MALEEAIEMSKSILKDRKAYEGGAGNRAIKLGIEAMKRTRARREHLCWELEPLLPGETED